ncbi:MAG: hypothetical protein PHS45_02390 [Bacilli bacterium]|nr:hypothetical protein [Bacilli bacterium]
MSKFITDNQQKIDEFLSGQLVDYSKKDFNFYEFDENFYVVIKKNKEVKSTKSLVNFHLGFPFPVFSVQKNISTKHIREFYFYFKGEPLRLEQRKILKIAVKNNFKESTWKEYDDMSLFRKDFDTKIKKFITGALLYVDPYNFIGDAFIGMHFLDPLFEKYKFSQRIIFSKSYMHIAMLGEAYPYDLNLVRKFFLRYKCLIFPDLLDVNFEKTLSILSQLSDGDGIVIFPGRSLYIVISKASLKCFHYNQPDVVLRDKNIEDYMNECMLPFISASMAHQEPKFIGKENIIFINPFGSLENKSINVHFIASLCKELNKNKGQEINLICGIRDCSFHADWVKKFIRLKKDKKIRCRLSYYHSLNQLVIDIHRLRPGVILTTDTSISHLAHRLNLPTIIFYHSNRFDNSSIQSMISESLLGFGRYFKNSYPLLIRQYTKSQVKVIAVLLNYLLTDKKNYNYQKFLKIELARYFPEEYFFNLVSLQYRGKILKILKKVSPINKL